LKPIFAVDTIDTIDNAENQQVKSRKPVDNPLTAVDKIKKPERSIDTIELR